MREQRGIELAPTDIEIDTDPDGRPVVRLDGAPVVSVAHTDGVAVAVAACEGTVGVDVERLAAPPPGFATAAFGADELEELPGERREEWLLRAWCAKEAVAKALGDGLRGRPKALAVGAVDASSGRIVVRVAGAPLTAHTAVQDDLAVATTLCEPGGASE
jgi:phosphopantetheinyl transferase